MNRFNAITSALFDPLLAPFGEEHAWFDMIFWSVAGGIVALIVYKYVSNQAGIQRAKNAIKVHLLEIRLFKDDLAVVLGATARILWKNALYLGHNILPMLVMIVPMMTILFQLEAHYAHDPADPEAGRAPTGRARHRDGPGRGSPSRDPRRPLPGRAPGPHRRGRDRLASARGAAGGPRRVDSRR
jgi:hypothetical protein